ncbi:MAG: hypothetical protein HKN04_02965 [Rhodothermaceae bacterium]|nr:hypothetical protein [Rhodothermaceae bacterium]
MLSCPRCTAAVLALLLLAFTTGCDTNNPSTPTAELEGTYDFTELTFDPTATALADADVLARLVGASTDVELFGSGQATIRFKLTDQPSQRADAVFTATTTTARLVAETETDAQRLATILVPSTLSFSRSGDNQRLTAALTTTVNLQAFDPQAYAGQTATPGTLRITLQRRSELAGGG